MIRITIASKHKDDRKIIHTLLSAQDDFIIASMGTDSFHAVRSSMTLKPDIIIMDYYIEGHMCTDIAPVIKRNSPSTVLIVLCPDDKYGVVDNALNAGISGFLLWKKDLDKLVPAVRSVFYGGLYISESARNILSVNFGTVDAAASVHQRLLTVTEHNIFNGIILGQSDKEIADDLNMSIGALRNCVNKVKKKTGLQNRTQITVYAMLNGIIDIGKVKKSLFNKVG
jgi:DNA-binding NarL/FixJ family response regulator